MDKNKLRRVISKLRDNYGEDRRRTMDEIIRGRLFSHPAYVGASHILTYVSFRSEVDTHEIIKQSLAQGKRVFCPVTRGFQRGYMDFYEIYSPEELIKGQPPFDMEEPPVSAERLLDLAAADDQLAGGKTVSLSVSRLPQKASSYQQLCEKRTRILMLVPGVAFDRQGGRLGYGGGYYDRYLERLGLARLTPTTIALSYPCQVLDQVPLSAHDRLMDQVLIPDPSC